MLYTVFPALADGRDLSQIQVYREWNYERNRIDILLLDETSKLAVIIENKIASGEGTYQLEVYWNAVKSTYPQWEVLGIYLTPTGALPSNHEYKAVSYCQVIQLLQPLLSIPEIALTTNVQPTDVQITIAHYIEMLRRHIVNQSDIGETARQVYMRHKSAFDRINVERTKWVATLGDLVKSLIEEREDLCLDDEIPHHIRFGVKEWDGVPRFRENSWTSTNRAMLFVFENQIDSLKLGLFIGLIGPQETHQRLAHLCTEHNPPFSNPKNISKKWLQVYNSTFLTSADYQGSSDADLYAKVRACWASFTEVDLPAMQEVFRLAYGLSQPNH